MTSIAYKVFHLPKDTERCVYVDKINSHLAIASFSPFVTPTIKISNDYELEYFLKNNKDFNLDLNGYNLDNVQGWKYGELGIWASNYIAWGHFLKSNHDILILMEDDISFNPDFSKDLKNKISELPEDWDIFSYFAPKDQHSKYNDRMSVSENISESYQDWSMLCYLVSKNGAEKLINSCKNPVCLPLDWHIYRQKHLFNVYSLKPSEKLMCDIHATESTFQNKHERKVINGIL